MNTIETLQERLSSAEGVALVRRWLRAHRGLGRWALARHVCEKLDLYDPRGEPRLAGVEKALRVLETRGLWRLPRRRQSGNGRWHPRRCEQAVPVPKRLPARVEELQGLELVEVSSEDDERFRIWNELMLSEHPLHDCRLVGRQLRYLIGSAHGWLGAIGFGACALRLQVRDQWIGWDRATRTQHQARLINMTRFLIRPRVRCENLASWVLSRCLERVGKDFEACYGFEPWLVETFVDVSRYAGSCFQAANWTRVGSTVGRGRTGPPRQVTTCKELYLYELHRNWRRQMGLQDKVDALEAVRLEESLQSEGWVEAEFGGAELGHLDSTQRLIRIAAAKARHPSATYPECYAGDRHELKAYYRFIGHRREKVCPAAILSGHRKRTMARMKGRKRVLVIQDTTELDFSERLHCNGLGDIGTNQTGAVSQGLKMHSSLALTEDGLPLGVLSTQIYASSYEGAQAAPSRPIEEKESYRWLRLIDELKEISGWVGTTTQLIGVGDRESDIFELFDYRRRKAPNVHLLARARHNRCLEDTPQKLFEHLEALPVMAQAQIAVPRQRQTKGKPSKPARIALPARTARVQLRWGAVEITAPATAQTRHLPPLGLHALMVWEAAPPPGAKPLRWILLTTLPIDSRKQALRILRWYTLRWRIEEWHRVLKSGCHIEAHQNHSAERIARAIAIDAVIAWRLMLLTLLGRQAPELPCEMVFSPWECRLLKILQPIVAPETITEQKRGLLISQPPV